jgi:A/G-specific adenine glycosylase
LLTEEKRSFIAYVKKKKKIFRELLISWARDNLREFPWRENPTPYSVLVTEILLRRTTAPAVKRVYLLFIGKYPDIEGLAKANMTEIEGILASLGYHKERARILHSIADFIQKNWRGKIPNSKNELMKMPHIGQYTAGAVLSLGFGIPSPMVDSNIERVLRRVFCSKVPPKGKMELILTAAELLVPEKDHKTYNLGLVDLGAMLCKHNNPKCELCPLRDICDYYFLIFKAS